MVILLAAAGGLADAEEAGIVTRTGSAGRGERTAPQFSQMSSAEVSD